MIGGRRGGMSAEEFLAQYERLAEKLDSEYSYRIARELENFRSDPVLGYRTAGSAAEFEAGEYLFGEMVRLGLRTKKHPVRIDGWEYKGASLTYETKEGRKTVLLGGYQTHFVAKDLKTELVDAGKGTEKDFAGTDVRGKIALIRINQRDEWWINYPAYQAHLAGALAVIAVQDKGYGEADPSALNAQDICGLPEAAAFSMSKRDMLDIVKEMDKGRIEVTLDADSRVTKDATAYNIVGTIPGKTSEMIAVSAHYDSYFHGFEDDNTGISMMLSLAKAVAESGYLPEKTLVFIAFACEEWGRTDSRYDWSAGAFAEMTQGVNDWRGKMIADINLELPAIAHGKKHYIRSVYEYKHFLRDFLKDPKGFDEYYPEGADVVCPVQTWSDDFSMAVNGVPSMVNEFASGSFMETHYHSQLDDHSSYDEKIYGRKMQYRAGKHEKMPNCVIVRYRLYPVKDYTHGINHAAAYQQKERRKIGDQQINAYYARPAHDDVRNKAVNFELVYVDCVKHAGKYRKPEHHACKHNRPHLVLCVHIYQHKGRVSTRYQKRD